ncbi:MAG: BrnT family toxin, partial [Taibaiella sp.]|nr:BrnT family toxin [Taibaiella sp.]
MNDPLELLKNCTGFQWDKGNLLKNWDKHEVSGSECEQVFFNSPLLAMPDEAHSINEPRYFVLGQTD